MDFDELEEFNLSPEVLKHLQDPEFLKKSLVEGKTLQEIFEYDNETLETFYQAASVLFEKQQYKEAADAFFFLTNLNPNIFAFWLGLGMSDHLNHHHESALIAYSMASLLDLDNPFPYYHSASCFQALNNESQALSFLDKAIKKASAREAYKNLKEQALAFQRKLSR